MERLKRRTDFRAAAQGARAPGKAFVLQARRRVQQTAPDPAIVESGAVRVGFTVSRQVGNAVVRNRVRRRLREIVRLAPSTKFCPGHDYVLIGRPPALTLPFRELVGDFDAALRRVHAATNNAPAGAAATGAAGERSPHKARAHKASAASASVHDPSRHQPPQKH